MKEINRIIGMICPPLWIIFYFIPHPHLWRNLTSYDYGSAFAIRFWGEYKGFGEQECVLCGKVRMK